MSATRRRDGRAAVAGNELLWEYCVRLYDGPGVPEACLALQDGTGADIPVMLAALWSAAHGPGMLGPDDLTALDREIAEWRDHVVRPLRAARRWLKAGPAISVDPGPLRDRIKTDELEAERIQLAVMANWLRAWPGTPTSDGGEMAALHAYLAWRGIAPDDPVARRLTAAIQAAVAG